MDSVQTKPCPKCEKHMILWETGDCYLTNPPMYGMEWWCGCGHTEDAPDRRGETVEERRRWHWERANSEDAYIQPTLKLDWQEDVESRIAWLEKEVFKGENE